MNSGRWNDREGKCAPFCTISVSLYIYSVLFASNMHLLFALSLERSIYSLIFEWMCSLMWWWWVGSSGTRAETSRYAARSRSDIGFVWILSRACFKKSRLIKRARKWLSTTFINNNQLVNNITAKAIECGVGNRNPSMINIGMSNQSREEGEVVTKMRT